jgi:Secretion system C-terminal sorting domain/Nidogen-like
MTLRYASLLLVGACLTATAQTVLSPHEYDVLKGHDQLPSGPITISGPKGTGLPAPLSATERGGGGGCNCWIAPDSSYSLAMAPNDDQSSDAIALPFVFELFGEQYDTLWINNNGNVSFDGPWWTYTANGFPDATFKMVAPFWADVDTRDTTFYDADTTNDVPNGAVLFKLSSTALYVNWIDVGYFSHHGELRNSFQLVITNGSDPVIPGGNNVSFCYQDMAWTTGDASQGQFGFGGSPATVGVNKGDGTNHSQIGRFGWDDNAYGGPYSDTSGVHWLDSTHFYMNTAGGNIPPIFGSNFNCDTVVVQLMAEGSHSPLHDKIIVLPGGPGQQVSCTAIASTLPGLNGWSSGFVDHVELLLEDYFTGATPGTHVITFAATSSGIEPLTSEYTLQIELQESQTIGIAPVAGAFGLQVLPNPAQDEIRLTWAAANSPVSVELIAADGRLVRTIPTTAKVAGITLNISDLSSGSYTVQVRFANGLAVQQLVKTDR